MFHPSVLLAGDAAAGPLSISNTANARDSANVSSGVARTHASLSLGAADANRLMVAALSWRGDASTNLTVSSVTINGVSASEIVRANGTGGASAALYAAIVPTGTTGDVVVTLTGNTSERGACSLYRIVSKTTSGAYQSGSDSSDAYAAVLDIPAGGVAIGLVTNHGSSMTSVTWTNLTQDNDGGGIYDAAGFHAVASASFASAQTALSLQGDANGSDNGVGVFASWGP